MLPTFVSNKITSVQNNKKRYRLPDSGVGWVNTYCDCAPESTTRRHNKSSATLGSSVQHNVQPRLLFPFRYTSWSSFYYFIFWFLSSADISSITCLKCRLRKQRKNYKGFERRLFVLTKLWQGSLPLKRTGRHLRIYNKHKLYKLSVMRSGTSFYDKLHRKFRLWRLHKVYQIFKLLFYLFDYLEIYRAKIWFVNNVLCFKSYGTLLSLCL